MDTCSVEECSTDAISRGLCIKHYNRMRKHGSTDDPRALAVAHRWESNIVRRPGGCWTWVGRIDKGGYGRTGKGSLAHRVMYEREFGPIPTGHDIDHQCHNKDLQCMGGPACLHRRCVNPAHLEPALHRTNVRRGRGGEAAAARMAAISQCPKGHPYDETNTLIRPNGARRCRECQRLESRRRTDVARARRGAPSRLGGRSLRDRLDEAKISAIRAARQGGETQDSLAKRFGVSRTAISNLETGKSYRHI